jgi:hypothetical protein
MADPPVSGPLIVARPGVQGEHAPRVTYGEGADPLTHSPGDEGFGGFVLSLADPPPVLGLHHPLAAPELPPPPRPALAGLGRPPGNCPGAGLPVVQVLVVLGADRPARDQQPFACRPGDRVRVDDPNINPGHPGRVGLLSRWVLCDRNLRGHIYPQPARVPD